VDALGRIDGAQVTALCDTYEPFLKRAASGAPKAETITDWRRAMESPLVDAVVIATPTPLHRDITIAALQSRKHVYCEAPIAASVQDVRAIGLAAAGATGVVFQGGLQGRSNPLYRHVLQFVKSGEWKVGEEKIGRQLGVEWHSLGEGFTWDSTNLEHDKDVKRSTLLVIVAAAAGASVLIAGCNTSPTFPPAAPTTGKRPQPVERDFRPSDIAKADIDVAAEAHVKECIASARLLMEKLYRRNPREWRKGGHANMEAAVARAFDTRFQFRFSELDNRRGTLLLRG